MTYLSEDFVNETGPECSSNMNMPTGCSTFVYFQPEYVRLVRHFHFAARAADANGVLSSRLIIRFEDSDSKRPTFFFFFFFFSPFSFFLK